MMYRSLENTNLPRPRFFGIGLLIMLSTALALPSSAQILPGTGIEDPNSATTTASTDEVATEIVLLPADLREAWLEVTPLTPLAEPVLRFLPETHRSDEPRRLRPDLPIGPAMVCTGAQGLGVSCFPHFHYRGPAADFQGSLEQVAEVSPGLVLTGQVRLGVSPVDHAEVAVVPAGLVSIRPFTLPLVAEGSSAKRLRRRVLTDSSGQFITPAIAPGSYFLEIHLPSGRFHRGPEFLLALPVGQEDDDLQDDSKSITNTAEGTSASEALDRRATQEPNPSEETIVDLGQIDVEDGLALDIRLVDSAEGPISAASIEARQGIHPSDLVTFEQSSNELGAARLVGLSAEKPVVLSFEAEGFRGARLTFELVPAVVTVILEPLATIRGEVTSSNGEPADHAVVSLRATDSTPAAVSFPEPSEEPSPIPAGNTLRTQMLDAEGTFRFESLAAGDYELTAAAPSRAVYRAPIRVAAGESLALEPITLLAGRQMTGRVIDRKTRIGIANAEIVASSPPGSVRTTTGSKGEFSFQTSGSESLELRFIAEGYADLTRTFTLDPSTADQPLEVTLEPAGWILAMARDGTAEQLPCQGCRLLLSAERARASSVASSSVQTLTTDPRGEALSRPLAPGRYRVQKPAIVHLGSTVIEQPDAETREVRVSAGEIEVVRFGESREHLTLRFEPAWERHWSLLVRRVGRVERLLPEADGSFRLPFRRGESPRLFAYFFDPVAAREADIYQADLPQDLPESELVIRLHPTELTGRIHIEGEPRAGLPIRLFSLTGEALATVWTGTDGAFSVPHLPPGVYSLGVGERSILSLSLRNGLSLDLGTFDLTEGSF